MNEFPYRCSMNALVAVALYDKSERERIAAEKSKRDQQIRDIRVLSQTSILDDICLVFNFDKNRVSSKCRSAELVLCRRIYCYLCCVKTKHSLKEIASELKCDHTTVIYHREMVKNLLEVKDSEFMAHWKYFIHNSTLFVDSDFQ